MFCPRCGRTVNETANFCGGCGMPVAEIAKYHKELMATPVITPVQEEAPVKTDELNDTIAQLESQLMEEVPAPVTDYTTEVAEDTITNDVTVTDFVQQEITAEQQTQESNYRPQYNYTVPEQTSYIPPQQTAEPAKADPALSTVDFIWMILISSLPVIGFIYLLYSAFAGDNANKRSWARATLIIGLFGVVLAVVFAMGITIAQFGF
ncbi:MAG: zinc-ribbon domain-containing protein [Oscillospiraceae bacterium]|nr:zinc-ribbon domain-containing protein [Oscillospiraceae bacterium]